MATIDLFSVTDQHKYFEFLKAKYCVDNDQENSLKSPLYLILIKGELNQQIVDLEWNYLQENKLDLAINILKRQQQLRAEAERDISFRYTKYLSKYKTNFPISPLDHSLMFILSKLESEDSLNPEEIKFFITSKQTKTLKMIEEIEEYKRLKKKYKCSDYKDNSLSSKLYFILNKLEKHETLNTQEIDWLTQQKLTGVLEIYQQQNNAKLEEFIQLKSKYHATDHEDLSLNSDLYAILKILDKNHPLEQKQLHWLKEQGLQKTEFIALKIKYKATNFESHEPSSHLYKILNRLEENNPLNDSDINFLKKRNLSETITLALNLYASILENKIKSSSHLDKADLDWIKKHNYPSILDKYHIALKLKYNMIDYGDPALSKCLSQILFKLDQQEMLSSEDITWIQERNLLKHSKILEAWQNNIQLLFSYLQKDPQNINISIADLGIYLNALSQGDIELNQFWIDFLAENQLNSEHFNALKVKYEASYYKNNSLDSPLYAILKKLENQERLEGIDIAWLKETKVNNSKYWSENNLFSRKIEITYHEIEANFYEQEYKRTGNKWNLPSISSHWRGAEQPEKALKITENIDLIKIKDKKVKSAILTTRGGAFRDIDKLDKAEECALTAIDYNPDSYHPYTLMGAICHETGRHYEADDWFREAIKRGYSERDQDAEIKRIIKRMKDPDKLNKLINYLLKKDENRYHWVKKLMLKDHKKVEKGKK